MSTIEELNLRRQGKTVSVYRQTAIGSWAIIADLQGPVPVSDVSLQARFGAGFYQLRCGADVAHVRVAEPPCALPRTLEELYARHPGQLVRVYRDRGNQLLCTTSAVSEEWIRDTFGQGEYRVDAGPHSVLVFIKPPLDETPEPPSQRRFVITREIVVYVDHVSTLHAECIALRAADQVDWNDVQLSLEQKLTATTGTGQAIDAAVVFREPPPPHGVRILIRKP